MQSHILPLHLSSPYTYPPLTLILPYTYPPLHYVMLDTPDHKVLAKVVDGETVRDGKYENNGVILAPLMHQHVAVALCCRGNSGCPYQLQLTHSAPGITQVVLQLRLGLRGPAQSLVQVLRLPQGTQLALQNQRKHRPQYNTIQYNTMLYYTILYYIIQYYIIQNYTILYYTILYNTIQYYTILYNIIQHYTILYYTDPEEDHGHNTIQYNTRQCYTILYHTTLYHTIL